MGCHLLRGSNRKLSKKPQTLHFCMMIADIARARMNEREAREAKEMTAERYMN